MAAVIRSLAAVAMAATLAAGCGTLSGPSLDFVAPAISGRIVDSDTGRPVRNAMVGRKLWTWRQSTGGFLKAGEEMVLREDYVRTGTDGAFELPAKRMALLFSIGDAGLNTALSVQHGAYLAWRTNFPMSALSSNAPAPTIGHGDILLTPK